MCSPRIRRASGCSCAWWWWRLALLVSNACLWFTLACLVFNPKLYLLNRKRHVVWTKHLNKHETGRWCNSMNKYILTILHINHILLHIFQFFNKLSVWTVPVLRYLFRDFEQIPSRFWPAFKIVTVWSLN